MAADPARGSVMFIVNQGGRRWSSQEDFCRVVSRRLAATDLMSVFAYTRRPGPLVEQRLREGGHTIEVLNPDASSLWAVRARVRALCQRHGARVVHLRHHPVGAPVVWVISTAATCPVVATDDSGGLGRSRGRVAAAAYRLHHRLIASRLGALVAPSRFIAHRDTEERGLPSRLVRHIPNGVDLTRFAPGGRAPAPGREAPDGRPVVLVVANLVPEKGVDGVIRAFARVRGFVSPRPRLEVVGDGPERGPLAELAAALGVRQHVTFLGERSDVETLLGGATILCCPSIVAEAFGWASAEAMACGVPVVASRVGAVPEVVEDGKTGLLAPPGDADGLAAAIGTLLADPALRARMGAAGRRRVERLFDLEAVAMRHVELYDELLART